MHIMSLNLCKAVFGCFVEINMCIVMHLWSVNNFFLHLSFLTLRAYNL